MSKPVRVEPRQSFDGRPLVDLIHEDGSKRRIDVQKLQQEREVAQGQINALKRLLARLDELQAAIDSL